MKKLSILVGAVLLGFGVWTVIQTPAESHDPIQTSLVDAEQWEGRAVELDPVTATSAGHVYFPAWFGLGSRVFQPVYLRSDKREPRPDEIRVVAAFNGIRNDRDLNARLASKLQGTLVPLSARPRVAAALHELYPGIDRNQCQLLVTQADAMIPAEIPRYAGIVLMLLGGACFLYPLLGMFRSEMPNITPTLPGAEVRQQAHLRQLALINSDDP